MPTLPTDAKDVFSLDYYESIIMQAKRAGYSFKTLQSYWDEGCPLTGSFVLRHDVDKKPVTLRAMLEREQRQGVVSTVFVLVTSNEYNLFDYRTSHLVSEASAMGCEIGLHTNFLEYAKLTDGDPYKTLSAEITSARAFFPDAFKSLACHRDYNYLYNSLPWIEENWRWVAETFGMSYQAYDSTIMGNLLYVNETVNPRLGWRTSTPEEAIISGKSICMSTHPHWWFQRHPFEF